MRRSPATLLAAAAVALAVVVAVGWRAFAAPPLDPPTDATAPAADAIAAPIAPEPPPAPAAAPGANPRVAADGAGGAIRGRIVDRSGAPLAGARARLVLGDATDGLPSARTDGDGRFRLAGVPLAAVAVRAEADGMTPMQLGDLDPARANDRELDAGTFVLAPAVACHGVVRARGRGVAGARVVLAPELGPPGTPTPVVQQTTTADDGHFFFPIAPPTPCFLRVDAAGHRRAPPQRVPDAQQPLQFELQPLARARGRVVDRATGAPIVGALVRAFAVPVDATAAPLPRAFADDADATRADADGAFDVELPDAARACLQADAPGMCPLAIGPLAASDDVGGLLLAVDPGSVVRGRVTFRGEPVAARASLRPLAAAAPTTVRLVGDDGALALGPAPTGAWLLRVDADVGARFERRVDLAAPAPLQLDVPLAEGSRLVGTARRDGSGTAVVVCTHDSGLQRRGLVGSDGRFAVEGLFPGRWRARLDVRDAPPAAVLLAALLDDDGFEVGGAPEARRDVVADALRLGRVDGFADPRWAGQPVALVASDERQQRVPLPLRSARVGADGRFAFDPALPGNWLVTLGAAAQPLRTARVEVVAGAATPCVFGP